MEVEKGSWKYDVPLRRGDCPLPWLLGVWMEAFSQMISRNIVLGLLVCNVCGCRCVRLEERTALGWMLNECADVTDVSAELC